MSLDIASIVLGAALGSVSAGAAVFFLHRRGSERGASVRAPSPPSMEQVLERTLSAPQVDSARRDLRLLRMEKEYLSSALTRVYEAEVQGRITKDEMQYLSQKYRAQLQEVEEKLSKAQMVVEVADLEDAKEELLSLVNNKVSQIDARLKELRLKVVGEAQMAQKAVEPTREEKKERVEPKKEKPVVMDEKLKKVVDDISEAMAKLEQMDMEQ